MKRWQEKDHLSSVLLLPPKARSDAIVMYVYRDAAASERRDAMGSIASRALSECDHVDRCLVLGMNIDKGHYPYTSLALFRR